MLMWCGCVRSSAAAFVDGVWLVCMLRKLGTHACISYVVLAS